MNRRRFFHSVLGAGLFAAFPFVGKLFGKIQHRDSTFKGTANLSQPPTRIDTLSLERWGKVTMRPLEWYDAGGQVIYPHYDKYGKCCGAVAMIQVPVNMPDGWVEGQRSFPSCDINDLPAPALYGIESPVGF